MKLLFLKRKTDGVVSVRDIVVHVDIERACIRLIVVVATNPAKAVLTLQKKAGTTPAFCQLFCYIRGRLSPYDSYLRTSVLEECKKDGRSRQRQRHRRSRRQRTRPQQTQCRSRHQPCQYDNY